MEFIENKYSHNPKISVILLDWSTRESFHCLHYLNNQTFPREEYEIIWIEFYNRKPKELQTHTDEIKKDLFIDKWIILGYPQSIYYHKHFMYNVGIVLSDGKICIICDSDAVFNPTFLENVYNEFKKDSNIVLHVDQVRNENKQFYPFNYPKIADIFGKGCLNWTGKTTTGLNNSLDMLHEANYGACMCALKEDLIAIGGADEHIDYLGYICGPYDMTFRLVNYGKCEKWLSHEWLYHTWHPGIAGDENYGGANDGRGMSLRALEVLQTGRIEPLVENSAIKKLRSSKLETKQKLLAILENQDNSKWQRYKDILYPLESIKLVKEGYFGFNIIYYQGKYYALAQEEGAFSLEKVVYGDYRRCYCGKSEREVMDIVNLEEGL
jgi:GT2 family glycosyltransferase